MCVCVRPWACGDRTQVLGRQGSKWDDFVPRGHWPCPTLAVATEVGVLLAPSGQRPGLVLTMGHLPRSVSSPGSGRPSWVATGCAATAPRLGSEGPGHRSEGHSDSAGCSLPRDELVGGGGSSDGKTGDRGQRHRRAGSRGGSRTGCRALRGSGAPGRFPRGLCVLGSEGSVAASRLLGAQWDEVVQVGAWAGRLCCRQQRGLDRCCTCHAGDKAPRERGRGLHFERGECLRGAGCGWACVSVACLMHPQREQTCLPAGGSRWPEVGEVDRSRQSWALLGGQGRST